MKRQFYPLKQLFRSTAFLAVLWFGTSMAQANVVAEIPYRQIVSEILRGLSETSVERISAQSGYGAPKIAILPFAETDLPVSQQRARNINRQMMYELQKQGKGRFEFVALDALENIITAIKLSENSKQDVSERIKDLRASTRADILVTGKFNGNFLSFIAVSSENAQLFATSRPYDISPPEISPRPAFKPAPIRVSNPQGRYRLSVQEAEILLAELGYDPGPVDGFMTTETRAALSNYQMDSALPVSGRLTRRVVENMRRDNR